MGCGIVKTEENAGIEKLDRKLVKSCKTQNKLTAHEANAFVITCMDFRLIDDDANLMDNLGYNTNYDLFVLAGASLGFVEKKFPEWGKTALEHMEIGVKLHHFRQIIFIDHFDCGAFKKFRPYNDKEEELKNHKDCIQEARDLIKARFPNFVFKAFIMDLSGRADEITVED
jgi:carbonic anhydrase